MSLENLQAELITTFSGNFVAYYRTHVAHVNITGPNFYSDHKLLQKIYEYFQDNIDTIAEKLRTVKTKMPVDIATVTLESPIMDFPTVGNCYDLLTQVDEAIEAMIEQYHALNDAAEECNYIDISNFAQDQISQLAKFRWMIEATTEETSEEDERDY